jgi:hypothetical protein
MSSIHGQQEELILYLWLKTAQDHEESPTPTLNSFSVRVK